MTGSKDRSSTRYRRTLSIKSSKEATPFFRSNASQAKDASSAEYRTKNPPPTMKFSGLWNLKRNGSPGCNTRNVLDPLDCKKLTSSGASRLRCSYQFLSVTPTQIFMFAQDALRTLAFPIGSDRH